MWGVYSYISETNPVCSVYNVAAVLQLQFMPHVMLFPILNVLYFCTLTERSVCAVASVAVFCTSLISFLPGISLRYFLNGSEMFPVAFMISGVNFVFYSPHAFYFYCEGFMFQIFVFFLASVFTMKSGHFRCIFSKHYYYYYY